MAEYNIQTFAIGSDTPLSDPVHDAFGYAPFARHLAETISKLPNPQGLVMAIHAPWGSGKTTLLNFVKYFLNESHKDKRPVIIGFNPWWFTNREHLADQFLSQFRVHIYKESDTLREIGNLMAEYSNAIGTTIAGAYGIPWLDKAISFILKLLNRKQKDIPTLKAEISEKLKRSNRRFVFFIDDIDRLTPNEMCELFQVVKALADFPNVIYLLAFDQNIAADALNNSLGIKGGSYLEKIVQVPLSLPNVDRLRLRQKLFTEIDRILESFPVKNFNQTRWGNIYYRSLDNYIKKPRDIVRVINSLSITYPAVANEVNPVDFVALEFLRTFEPLVYDVIRDNQEMFVGYANHHNHNNDRTPERQFHESWIARIPEEQRPQIKELIPELFPKVNSIWGNMAYGHDFYTRWRRELRVCCREIFDVYFQFSVPSDSVKSAEIEELIRIAVEPERAIEYLKATAKTKRPDGHSKTRDLLERIKDFTDEIPEESATGLLIALSKTGDDLLPPEDEQRGFASIPNRLKIYSTAENFLKCISETGRFALLQQLINEGSSICLLTETVVDIERTLTKPDENRDSPLLHINQAEFDQLKALITRRFAGLTDETLLSIPEADYVIHHWARWAGNDVISRRLEHIFSSVELLPRLLEKYISWATRSGWGDMVAQRIPRLNPRSLENLTDINQLETHVTQLLERNDLSTNQRTAGEQYLKGMRLIREGRNPGDFLRDDD